MPNYRVEIHASSYIVTSIFSDDLEDLDDKITDYMEKFEILKEFTLDNWEVADVNEEESEDEE